MTIELKDLEPGRSYACMYTDLTGPALAIIVKRDVENQLVELRDLESNHTVILAWDQVYDIDTVEWRNE